jgi:hypothetical protein
MQLYRTLAFLIVMVIGFVNAAELSKHYNVTDIDVQRAADGLIQYLCIREGIGSFMYAEVDGSFRIDTFPNFSFKITTKKG